MGNIVIDFMVQDLMILNSKMRSTVGESLPLSVNYKRRFVMIDIAKELDDREKNKDLTSICFSSEMSKTELKRALLAARAKAKSFNKK